MFEVWGRKGKDNLVDMELDFILRSENDISIISVDEWVRRCRGAVVHGRLYDIRAARPCGGTKCIRQGFSEGDKISVIRSTEVIADCSVKQWRWIRILSISHQPENGIQKKRRAQEIRNTR